MPAVAPFATRHAPHGMVCAIDHLAAEAGVSILRLGGSAADAAVGASAVLAVTSQHLCGMGGDLFALVSVPGQATPLCLNASGRAGAGAAASAARLRAAGQTVMPFEGDPASVPVPGCVDGWVTVHSRLGRLPLAEVLEPARVLAADGFPATPTLVGSVGRVARLAGAGDYTDEGRRRLAAGDVVRRPGVARTLAAIGAGGRAAFYEGEFGEGLLALGDGEYDDADLSAPSADWVTPLGAPAWDRTLWSTPPNSQGYLTLASAWIASGLELPADPADPLWAHLLVESARAASWDRPDVLWDGADGAALIHPGRLGPRRASISPDRAVDGWPAPAAAGDTIYLCAVDSDRMGVSLIQSNASGWGSGLVEPATRIFLHNRGIGFSLDPSHPAALTPGRRPPHTLSPALVTGPGGALDTVLGTMGGDGQPQVLLQLLARLLAGDATGDPAAILAAGRFTLGSAEPGRGFDTWSQGSGRVAVDVEGHAPDAWDAGLAERGHVVRRGAPWSHGFGHAHVISVRSNGEMLAGATDPRPLTGACTGY